MHRQSSTTGVLRRKSCTKATAKPSELLSKARRRVEAAAEVAAEASHSVHDSVAEAAHSVAEAAHFGSSSDENGCGIVYGTVSVAAAVSEAAAAAAALGLKGQTKLISAASAASTSAAAAAAANFHGSTKLTCGNKGAKLVAAARVAHLGSTVSGSSDAVSYTHLTLPTILLV